MLPHNLQHLDNIFIVISFLCLFAVCLATKAIWTNINCKRVERFKFNSHNFGRLSVAVTKLSNMGENRISQTESMPKMRWKVNCNFETIPEDWLSEWLICKTIKLITKNILNKCFVYAKCRISCTSFDFVICDQNCLQKFEALFESQTSFSQIYILFHSYVEYVDTFFRTNLRTHLSTQWIVDELKNKLEAATTIQLHKY